MGTTSPACFSTRTPAGYEAPAATCHESIFRAVLLHLPCQISLPSTPPRCQTASSSCASPSSHIELRICTAPRRQDPSPSMDGCSTAPPKKPSAGPAKQGAAPSRRPKRTATTPPAAPPPRVVPSRRLQEGARHQGAVDAQTRGTKAFAIARGGGGRERIHPKASRKGIDAKGVDFGEAAGPARGFPRTLTRTLDPPGRQ